MLKHVFVYGYLMKGMCIHGWLRDAIEVERARFVGNGHINGRLYWAQFAVVALGGNGTVKGEVYEVDAGTLRELDHAERILPDASPNPYWYRRYTTKALLSGEGRFVDVEVYAWKRPPLPARGVQVMDGDFRAFIARGEEIDNARDARAEIDSSYNEWLNEQEWG